MKKILLLDDNTIAYEKSICSLEQKYSVCRCKDILTAARRLRNTQFDLIIIDLMMPTKGLSSDDEFNAGFNFYNQYVVGDLKKKPVIFWTHLSKTAYDKYIKNSIDHESMYYLQKSTNESVLLNLVDEIL